MRGEETGRGICFEGTDKERNNAAPTLVFYGSPELAGEGGIRISARIGNSAIWSEVGSLTLSGGLAEIKKTDLLGFEGGAVNAGGDVSCDEVNGNVSAGGDGLDSNGNETLSVGSIIVWGASSSGSGSAFSGRLAAPPSR